MNYYPDESLFIHSFHTVVIDRHGKLVANLEGNEFTAKQLGESYLSSCAVAQAVTRKKAKHLEML